MCLNFWEKKILVDPYYIRSMREFDGIVNSQAGYSTTCTFSSWILRQEQSALQNVILIPIIRSNYPLLFLKYISIFGL
jgi:hypothetical protein